MNWPSIIILAVIIAAVLAVIVAEILKKKKGKSSCSCGGACGACPMGGTCHQKEEISEK